MENGSATQDYVHHYCTMDFLNVLYYDNSIIIESTVKLYIVTVV